MFLFKQKYGPNCETQAAKCMSETSQLGPLLLTFYHLFLKEIFVSNEQRLAQQYLRSWQWIFRQRQPDFFNLLPLQTPWNLKKRHLQTKFKLWNDIHISKLSFCEESHNYFWKQYTLSAISCKNSWQPGCLTHFHLHASATSLPYEKL